MLLIPIVAFLATCTTAAYGFNIHHRLPSGGRSLLAFHMANIPSPVSGATDAIAEKDSWYRDDDDDDFEVRRIKRSWKGGRGYLKADLILPDDDDDEDSSKKNIRGVIFFLHGFSQTPKAYRESLEQVSNKLQVAIVAPEVDAASPQVLEDLVAKVGDAQYCLQRALVFDAIQCIQMTLDRQEPFASFLPKEGAAPFPIGVTGHSMGGGLSWYVASKFPDVISYVAAMAPYPGVAAFAPSTLIAPAQSLLMAGLWDLIAKASEVQKLTAIANSVKPKSSIYVEISRGFHTGFEDDLVLFNVPITSWSATLLYFQIIGGLEAAILNNIESFLTGPGQLCLMRALLEYTFENMIEGKPLQVDEVLKSLEANPDIRSNWLSRVSVKQ